MTPPGATAQGGALLDEARRLDTRPQAPRRTPLRVVTRPSRGHRGRRRPVALVLSVVLVTASMLAVVLGHALLAEGQVRLSKAQAALSAEQAKNRQEQLATARLEMPSRIVGQAEVRLHMVQPQQITQIPYTPPGQPAAATTGARSSDHAK